MKQLRLLCAYRDRFSDKPRIDRYRLLFVPMNGRNLDKAMRRKIDEIGTTVGRDYSSNLILSFEKWRGAQMFEYRQLNLDDKPIETMQDWDHMYNPNAAREALIVDLDGGTKTLHQFSTIGETKQFLKRAKLCLIDEFELSLMGIQI